MRTEELHFDYPQQLVATEPAAEFRIMWNHCGESPSTEPQEISKTDLFQLFQPGDVLAINETKVLKRRVTSLGGLEILFLDKDSSDSQVWEVLCPARQVKDDETFMLPGGVEAQIIRRGIPQFLRVSRILDESYFREFGELALPPYIQKARNERHNRTDEEMWYQTSWGKNPGSLAAPTASLHFSAEDLMVLKEKHGVIIAPFTLHVGIGTFLPIRASSLVEHEMHAEDILVPHESVDKWLNAKAQKKRIWALGTTAVRALESYGGQLLESSPEGFRGSSQLFVRPGHNFKMVDQILTNFHQPQSTLLALVAAYSSLERVLNSYKWAVERKFRLFSYGDLTVWTR